MPRAGQGVAAVELVPDRSVLVSSRVALGLVACQLAIIAASVDVDDLLEDGAGCGPELVAATGGLALGSPSAPRQWLGGEAVSVDEDAALTCSAAAGGCYDSAAGDGLDLVEVDAAPGAVGGETV